MNNFIVFFRKEWLELIRTKKLFIFLGVFVLFGMASPVLSRYMQEIFAASMGDAFPLEIPSATWVDSYSQLYSNLSQMGALSVIFIFMGCVAGEKQNGSAALTLTKNLSHSSFVMAKFTAAAVLLVVSTLASVLLCYAYTYYLFGYAGGLPGVFMGALAYGVFALVLLGATVLSSTIAKSTSVAALLSFGGLILLLLSSYVPKVGEYLPGRLLSMAMELTTSAFSPAFLLLIAVSVCITGICLLAAVRILKKQEI